MKQRLLEARREEPVPMIEVRKTETIEVKSNGHDKQTEPGPDDETEAKERSQLDCRRVFRRPDSG